MSEVKKWYVGVYGGEAQARACSPAEFEIINEREGRSFVLSEDFDRVTAERDALQQRLTASEGEQLACMPVERCYDVRAKMIIAFNEAKKEGGDLDDALDAAYKSALRYSPNPLSAEQPAPVAVMLPAQRNSADGRHDERVEGYNEALADVRRAISFSAKQL